MISNGKLLSGTMKLLKEKLEEYDVKGSYELHKINGDGNCLYRSILFA